ncbi:MAG: type II toxin-antitoxin system RelE/ParE family toxin [Caulobacterales bacterium]
MAQVVWTRRALKDLAAIQAYISQFNPPAAQRVAQSLAQAGFTLAEHPERGRLRADGRRELVTVPPYIIRYRVRGEHVEILTVRHGARRPT